jgi:oligoendopeptidase F
MNINYPQSSWSLTDLFPSKDCPELVFALSDVERMAMDFESCREQLEPGISPEKFLEIIRSLEDIQKTLQRIYAFAGLSFRANTQDQDIQSMLAQVDQLAAGIQNRTLFFSLWWKALDDENSARLIQGSGDYRYWLEKMRLFKPHTLTEPEEKIINIKDVTGSNALTNLYDTITNRYTFKIEEDGEEKELTRGELMVYARGADPDLRAAAYQELYRIYGADALILGQMYAALVRDWYNEQVELRRFPSPISAQNLSNNIPDQVVDTLLDVCQRNSGIFHRFFRLKARLIGMERLRRYDIYAPVVQSDKKYEFDQAADMVLNSFKTFDPKLAELAGQVFDTGHLDSEVRRGKASGAFCWTVVPELTPWVLLNYQGKADDVATMAHELGHAIHSMLAGHHSAFTNRASLPLAETASTFGEMMLVDNLLATETDESVRRDLLFRQVDDAYATILRQAFFALFERQAHQMIRDGASTEDLANAYMENLKAQFGDSVELPDEFRWEWVSIPHIYQSPFYVYAYAFGQLLVLSLYKQFKAEGEAFKPRYLRILSAGGSDSPEHILRDAGIDIYSMEFWQGGFDVVDELVSQLEELTMERE